METGRLRDVADSVVADFKQQKILTLIDTVINTYAATISSPNPDSAAAFETAISNLRAEVASTWCAQMSPSRQRILEHIGGAHICGTGLLDAIDAAISSGPTPASTLERLQAIRGDAASFSETMTQLRAAFTKLKIASDTPPGDHAEVEVALPIGLVDGQLGTFAKESGRLNRALQDITEVVTGHREHIEIRGLGTGSLDLYLAIDLQSGATLITFLTAIVNLINSTGGLRRTRQKLEQEKAPKEVLKPMEQWEHDRVDAELKRLTDEIMKSSPAEKTRKAELKKALADSLKYLADRVDRGMDIDVTVSEPDVPEGEAPPETPESQARREIIRDSGAIARIERSDESVLLLAAPALEDDDEADGKQSKG